MLDSPQSIVHPLSYLIAALCVLWSAKLISKRLASFRVNQKITRVDNNAIALSFAGFVIAVAFVLSAAIQLASLEGSEISASLLSFLVWALLGSLLLISTRWFNCNLVLPDVHTKLGMIIYKNLGIGAIQTGIYITAGLIINASLGTVSGELEKMNFITVVVWFVTAQAILLLICKIYQRTINMQIFKELDKENAAAGISFAGTLISIGIILSGYIKQCSGLDDIIGFLVWVPMASLLLLCLQFLVGKILLPACNLKKEINESASWGAGLIQMSASIFTALLIAAAFS